MRWMGWQIAFVLFLMLVRGLSAQGLLDPESDPEEPGPFERAVREQQFLGPGILQVPVEGTPAPWVSCLPSDLERPAALVVVADRLAEEFPETFAGLVEAAMGRTALIGLAATDASRTRTARVLVERRLPIDAMPLVSLRTDTIWIRDFGPVLVTEDGQSLAALDFAYLRRSGRQGRLRDDAAGASLAALFQLPTTHVTITVEGGNLLSDGRGTIITTTGTFNANILRGHGREELLRTFGDVLGARQLAVLEPLQGELTGHADLFACWANDHTLIVGEYSDADDPINAAVLDRNAAILSQLNTADGEAVRVLRVPMPGHDDGVWRTFTNAVFLGDLVILPRYPSLGQPVHDHAADVFRQARPAAQILWVPCERLAARGGALRCVTLPIPSHQKSIRVARP